jgi:hypothetical protein
MIYQVLILGSPALRWVGARCLPMDHCAGRTGQALLQRDAAELDGSPTEWLAVARQRGNQVTTMWRPRSKC